MRTKTPRHLHAFTLIELVIVLAIVGILALIVTPSFIDRIIREQVQEGERLGLIAMKGVAAIYESRGAMPVDNAAAGLPPADAITGDLVQSVTVNEGAVTVVYGSNANSSLKGKKLTWRPAISPGYKVLGIEWLCHERPVPDKREVLGKNESDIDERYLPLKCRNMTKKPS